MRSPVHTRRIVNPLWGTKVTGTAGPLSLGLLESLDESPEDDTLFSIGRATYGLGGSNYVGAIFTDTRPDRIIMSACRGDARTAS